MTDTPLSGVTLYRFEVSVTGLTLNRAAWICSSKGPIQIEVKQLETDRRFSAQLLCQRGAFTSLTLTFATPNSLSRTTRERRWLAARPLEP